MFVNDSSWAFLPKALRLEVCHDFAPQRTSQKLDRHRQTASPQHPAKSVLCCFLPSEVRLSIPTTERTLREGQPSPTYEHTSYHAGFEAVPLSGTSFLGIVMSP